MTGRTHQMIGVAAVAGAGYALRLPGEVVALAAFASYAASKLPDLDIRIPGLEHRGRVTHGAFTTIPVMLAAAAYLIATQPPVADVITAGVTAGIILHLAADACTITGICGWPVTRRVWLLPPRMRMVTGGRRRKARDWYRAPRRTRRPRRSRARRY